jgi:hypothetical protein
MTARVLPGTRVRMGALRLRGALHRALRDGCGRTSTAPAERIPDVPVDLLTIVARHGTFRNIVWRDWHDTD